MSKLYCTHWRITAHIDLSSENDYIEEQQTYRLLSSKLRNWLGESEGTSVLQFSLTSSRSYISVFPRFLFLKYLFFFGLVLIVSVCRICYCVIIIFVMHIYTFILDWCVHINLFDLHWCNLQKNTRIYGSKINTTHRVFYFPLLWLKGFLIVFSCWKKKI